MSITLRRGIEVYGVCMGGYLSYLTDNSILGSSLSVVIGKYNGLVGDIIIVIIMMRRMRMRMTIIERIRIVSYLMRFDIHNLSMKAHKRYYSIYILYNILLYVPIPESRQQKQFLNQRK